jgi:hypothetical protein
MPETVHDDQVALLRAKVADIVAATRELEEVRQRVASLAACLAESLPGELLGSVEADMDIKRRADGIVADVDGDSVIELDQVPLLVSAAVELQSLVEFFLVRPPERAVAKWSPLR